MEGLIVPTEEEDRSSGGMEDSSESKDGRLCPFMERGDDSVNEMPKLKEAQLSSVGKEE